MLASDQAEGRAEQGSAPRPIAALFRRNGWMMGVAAAATIAMQLGAYLAARRALGPAAGAQMGLLAGLLWLLLAVPIFTAAGGGALGGLFCGGLVIDSSAVLLIVLAAQGALTPLGAVQIYLIWAAVGLAESTFVLAARRAPSRQVLALLAGLVVLALAASPFWANGIVLAGGPVWREQVSYALTAVNPVFASSACLPRGLGFVWNEKPILYEATALGRDVPKPDVAWYVTPAAYAAVAAALAAVTVARRRR